ncbi:MAG: SUMF1/EgtB/PvdO family nonheme iron enzyme, partial [Myxococcota bacterium]
TFLQSLSRDGLGLVYYSGYAIQVHGRNYLIPVDANIRTEADVELEALELGRIILNAGSSPSQAIFIFDASHTSPHEQSFRSTTEGMAFIQTPNNVFVGMAHSPGAGLAHDPKQKHDLYTKAWIEQLTSPDDREWAQITRAVRTTVSQVTGEAQMPWESYRLASPFFVAQAEEPPQTLPVALTPNPEGHPVERTINGQRNTVPAGWVLIRPGSFMMGSPTGESSRSSSEQQHEVTLTRSFLMQKTEVTQRQWMEIMGSNPSQFNTCEDCPVERISLFDAVHFANEMSIRAGFETCYILDGCSGKVGTGCSSTGCTGDYQCSSVTFVGLQCAGYRLPTEAEWEYAARAGTQTMRYGPVGDIAWYADNSRGSTHPVGQKTPNAWGLYDMLGNVWEWIWGWHSPYPKGSVVDPVGSPSTHVRVNRGAGWRNHPRHVRFAMRHSFSGRDRYNSFGMRLVRTWSAD